MKKLFLIFSLLFAGVAPAAAEVVDQIVAEVNGEIITYSELRRVLDPIYAQYSKVYQGEDLVRRIRKAKTDALNQLIENKLIVQEAKGKGLSLNESLIDERVKEVKKRFKTEEEFLDALKEDGASYDDFVNNVRDQLIVKAYVSQEVTSKVTVTPKEIKTYYDAHLDEFSEEEKAHVFHIMVRKDPSNLPLSKETANQILAKVKSGGSFTELAKSYSEGPNADKGGDLGFVRRGQLIKELEDNVFALKVGETTGLIETQGGYHILWLKEKEKSSQKALADVEQDVEAKVFREKAAERHDKWIASLKKKAFINVFE